MPAALPPVEPEARVVELDLDDLPEVTVVVRRNPRARHVRISVDDSGVVTASIPRRFALKRLDPIVRERGAWLRETLLRMDLASRATEVDLRRGDPVRLLGRWLSTRLVEGGRPRGQLLVEEGVLELTVPAGRDPYDVLERWYREQARLVITERVDLWAREFGLRTGALSIRDQRTRWGSCSHKADLSFNWRLLLAPLWVLDAIVVHELCHIEELNHGDAFWALVHERYPEHDAANEWLHTHGPALRITRPRPRLVPHAVEPEPLHLEPAPPRPRFRRRRAGAADGRQESLF